MRDIAKKFLETNETTINTKEITNGVETTGTYEQSCTYPGAPYQVIVYNNSGVQFQADLVSLSNIPIFERYDTESIQKYLDTGDTSGAIKKLNTDFEKVYAVSKGDILEHIYRRPLANRYIASFAAFAGKHKDEKYIQDLLKNSFRKYFKRTIMKYPEHLMYPVHFTGSIAWNFSELLKTTGEELGLKIGTISENPLDGLVEFHRGKAK